MPGLVRMTEQALREGKCVVIGLQSTGEARTVDVIAERGEELDDFVSGPKVLPLTTALPLALFTPLSASHCECDSGETKPLLTWSGFRTEAPVLNCSQASSGQRALDCKNVC